MKTIAILISLVIVSSCWAGWAQADTADEYVKKAEYYAIKSQEETDYDKKVEFIDKANEYYTKAALQYAKIKTDKDRIKEAIEIMEGNHGKK